MGSNQLEQQRNIKVTGFSMYDQIPKGFGNRRYGEYIEGFLIKENSKIYFVYSSQQSPGYDQEDIFIVSTDNDSYEGDENDPTVIYDEVKDKFPYNLENCKKQFESFADLITSEDDIYGMNYNISPDIFSLFNENPKIEYVEYNNF